MVLLVPLEASLDPASNPQIRVEHRLDRTGETINRQSHPVVQQFLRETTLDPPTSTAQAGKRLLIYLILADSFQLIPFSSIDFLISCSAAKTISSVPPTTRSFFTVNTVGQCNNICFLCCCLNMAADFKLLFNVEIDWIWFLQIKSLHSLIVYVVRNWLWM